jgi:hypothetical protein
VNFNRTINIVREAIRTHSSPSIDRSDSHGCKGQRAYHDVDNHVAFIARQIAEGMGEEQVSLVVCRARDLSGEVHVGPEGAMCELRENPDRLTAELIQDMVRNLVKPVPKGAAAHGVEPAVQSRV